jgi:hypothetical protein
MCNLHDISWGNRPSVAAGQSGTNTFSEDAKKQANLKKDYEVFRVNFFTFWVVINFTYILVIQNVIAKKQTTINDGSLHFLEIISLAFAGIVVFKIVTCICYLFLFKVKLSCSDELKVQEIDLEQEVERLKAKGGYTDVDQISMLT